MKNCDIYIELIRHDTYIDICNEEVPSGTGTWNILVTQDHLWNPWKSIYT